MSKSEGTPKTIEQRIDDLTEVVKALVEIISNQVEQGEELQETIHELVEKVENISTPGADFRVFGDDL